VLAEVVAALAHRSHDPPRDRLDVGGVAVERDDAVARLVERRAYQIVHPGVDHEPPGGGRDLRLDDACEQDAVGRNQRASRLDIERQVAQAPRALLGPHRPHEVRRRQRHPVAVVDAEAASRVDECERRKRPRGAHLAHEAEQHPRRVEVRLERRELRSRVHPHPDQLEVRRRGRDAGSVQRVLERDAELRLVVPRRDVRVRHFGLVDARVDPHAHAHLASRRPRPRLQARDLLDALDLHRADAPAAAPDGPVDLLVALGHAAVDDAFGVDAARQGHEQLGPADHVRAAPSSRDGAHHGPRAVRLHGVADQVRRCLEGSLQRARGRADAIQIVRVARRARLADDLFETHCAE